MKPEFEWLGDLGEFEKWADQHVDGPYEFEVLPGGQLQLPGPDGQPVLAGLEDTITLAAGENPGGPRFVVITNQDG